jgi:hypothetical protein
MVTVRPASTCEQHRHALWRPISPKGHLRKSDKVGETSAFGGKAEVDLGRLDVCL